MACCSLSTVRIGSTGPKISSRMIRMSCVTPVSTIGAMKWPVEPGDVHRPSAHHLGARCDGVVDKLHDEVELLLRHHRPDLGAPVQRVADAEPACLAHDALDEAVGHVLHHVCALDAGAGLAGVRESAPHGT